MTLQINESIFISEGGTQKICVDINDHGQIRQRDILFLLSVIPHSVDTGMLPKCMLHLIIYVSVIKGDYNLTNVPAIIPVEKFQACFQVVAIDDTIVENDESFTIAIKAANSNDEAVGNTTVIIIDNDCK